MYRRNFTQAPLKGARVENCQTLIRADHIITQNGNRQNIENGGIAISNGIIEEIGPWDIVRQNWQAEEVISHDKSLVMPGLVNAHTHAAMTFLRGMADDLPLMEWLEKSVFPVEARLSPEIVELGSLLGYAEMLATGTTACIDMYIFEDAVFRAAEKAGIRCMGGEAVFAFPSAACRDWREALERTRELARRQSDNLKIAVNPHSVYTTDREILAACRDLALELDLPVHIHLAETAAETARCVSMTGMRPVAWLEKNGLLETRLIAAHLVDINAGEAARLAASGAAGVHNPSSNMKLASGAAPVELMRENGLPVALGTDGPASNNCLNMFTEMGRAALLHKLATGNPASLPAGAVLDMATRAGARAFGGSLTGTLEKGAPADLAMLDLSGPHMQPLYNPVSQAVYAASGHECRLTMVNGEILYRDGKFTGFDYDGLLREAAKLRKFAAGR